MIYEIAGVMFLAFLAAAVLIGLGYKLRDFRDKGDK